MQRLSCLCLRRRVISTMSLQQQTSSNVPPPECLIKSGNGKVKKVLTLAFVRKDGQVLLGMKKRGFGKDLWNGFGGKVDPGETIVEAAAREINEESCLTVKVDDLEQVGVIDFEWVGQSVLHEVHVFKASQFTGEPEETEEMRPQWFPEESIPFTQMWLDDKVWYPFLLQDVKFKGYFLFRGNTEILSYTLRDYLDDGKVLLGFETDPHLEAAKFS